MCVFFLAILCFCSKCLENRASHGNYAYVSLGTIYFFKSNFFFLQNNGQSYSAWREMIWRHLFFATVKAISNVNWNNGQQLQSMPFPHQRALNKVVHNNFLLFFFFRQCSAPLASTLVLILFHLIHCFIEKFEFFNITRTFKDVHR